MPVLKVYKNGTWENVSGSSGVTEHTHTINEITDFPSSLPANGGNADTLDGKHADEFLTDSELSSAINTALTQAKESGEFDGADGSDYVLTEADKQEIAELVEIPESGTVTDEQIASAVEDYMAENPSSGGFVAQDTAPEDTSVLWADTSDNSEDENTMTNYYTKNEIDNMLGSYVNDIANLVGGDA